VRATRTEPKLVRSPRNRSRVLLRLCAAALAVTSLIGLSACSFNTEEPATVTLPEHGTTTSTTPTSLPPDQGAAAEPEAPPKLAWALQVGGVGEDVLNGVAGVDTSVVAVGSTSQGVEQPAVGGTDVLSVTVDSEGAIQSTDQFGTTGDESAAGVAASGTGSLACGSTTGLLGAISGSGNSGGAAGGASGGASGEGVPGAANDVWCAPLPSSASQQVTQLGGSGEDRITGVALPQGPAQPKSNLPDAADVVGFASGVVDGYFPGAEDPAGRGLGAGDALAVRVNADGTALWARQFGTSATDAALGVCTVAEDGIFVGFTDGDLEGRSKGLRDAWISRIDSKGVQRWITQFGGAGTEEFRAVATSGDARQGTERFIAVGSTDGDIDQSGPLANSGSTDTMITAFASDGTIRWATQLGSEFEDVATAVTADGDNIYVAGTTRSGLNTAGGAAQDDTAGGAAQDDTAGGAAQDDTAGGAAQDDTAGAPGLIGLGDLNEEIGPGGGTDTFLASLDAETGEVRWVTRMGSAADEITTGLSTTEGGLLVLSGTTTGQVASTPPAGGTDGFLLAFQLPKSGGAAASSV
jgi:hypothetical protein